MSAIYIGGTSGITGQMKARYRKSEWEDFRYNRSNEGEIPEVDRSEPDLSNPYSIKMEKLEYESNRS